MRSKSAPFQDKLTLSVAEMLANGIGLSSSNKLFYIQQKHYRK